MTNRFQLAYTYNELFYTYTLTKFIVKIYKIKSAQNIVSISELDSLTPELNNCTYPRNIVENLQFLDGIGRIEILNLQNKVLLNTQVFVK